MTVGEEEINPILCIFKGVIFDLYVVIFLWEELGKISFEFIGGEDDETFDFSTVGVDFRVFLGRLCRGSCGLILLLVEEVDLLEEGDANGKGDEDIETCADVGGGGGLLVHWYWCNYTWEDFF